MPPLKFEMQYSISINPKPPSDAARKQKKNNNLEDLFSSALSQFKRNITPLETSNLIILAFSIA